MPRNRPRKPQISIKLRRGRELTDGVKRDGEAMRVEHEWGEHREDEEEQQHGPPPPHHLGVWFSVWFGLRFSTLQTIHGQV